MRSLVQAALGVVVLSAPAFSFAQSNAPITRAPVGAEIIELEHAGYHMGAGNNINYPEAIEATEARVAAQRAAASGYGGVESESSVSRCSGERSSPVRPAAGLGG